MHLYVWGLNWLDLTWSWFYFQLLRIVPVAGVGSRRLLLLIPDLQAVLFCGSMPPRLQAFMSCHAPITLKGGIFICLCSPVLSLLPSVLKRLLLMALMLQISNMKCMPLVTLMLVLDWKSWGFINQYVQLWTWVFSSNWNKNSQSSGQFPFFLLPLGGLGGANRIVCV